MTPKQAMKVAAECPHCKAAKRSGFPLSIIIWRVKRSWPRSRIGVRTLEAL